MAQLLYRDDAVHRHLPSLVALVPMRWLRDLWAELRQGDRVERHLARLMDRVSSRYFGLAFKAEWPAPCPSPVDAERDPARITA
jgi:hypothetical protein